jgi:WD40 repeat protein
VYAMILNNRKRELILGCTNCIQFHQLFETKEGFSHYVEAKPLSIVQEHTDIIRCLLVLDSKIYSAGYDGALVIYDNVFSGKESAIKCFKNSRAHDAGIACIAIEKDSIENNIWIFTGSFDKTLKVWTGDGKFVHRFDGFISCVTGVCYLPKMKIVCFVAGTSSAFMYDPKSGEDVTEFIDTFAEEADSNQYIQLIKYLGEYNMLLATTSRRQLIVYKYNQCGCLTSLKYRQCLDSIAYTSKVPILIFTGDQNGNVFKWEQRQSNQLIYGSENLLKSEMVERESSKMLGQIKSNDLIKSSSSRL